MATKKIRLDKLLVDCGIAPTLEKARALILARAVKVNETYLDKAGALVGVAQTLHQKEVQDDDMQRKRLAKEAMIDELDNKGGRGTLAHASVKSVARGKE